MGWLFREGRPRGAPGTVTSYDLLLKERWRGGLGSTSGTNVNTKADRKLPGELPTSVSRGGGIDLDLTETLRLAAADGKGGMTPRGTVQRIPEISQVPACAGDGRVGTCAFGVVVGCH